MPCHAGVATLQKGLPTVREEGIFTIRMPNSWNFGWDHALFVQVRRAADVSCAGLLQALSSQWATGACSSRVPEAIMPSHSTC